MVRETTRGDEWFVDDAGDIQLTTVDLDGNEQETWFAKEDLERMLAVMNDQEGPE